MYILQESPDILEEIVGNAVVERENLRDDSEVVGGSRVDAVLSEVVLQLIVKREVDRIDLLLLDLNAGSGVVEAKVAGLRCIVAEDSVA